MLVTAHALRSKATMKMLVLCRYSRLGASSRYRIFQYFPYLREQGFDLDVIPLLDDAYLGRRYARQRVDAFRLVGAFARRLLALVSSRRYDLVWLEKEALPWVPGWVEGLLTHFGAPYVVDYDDAIFHRYDQHHSAVARRLFGRKIDDVMRGAALVVVGNRYLAERAWSAGARRVELLPTVVDLTHYPQVLPGGGIFTIGWIGTPLTARYLEQVRPALSEVCADGRAKVVAIGAGDLNWSDVPIEVQPWSEESEVTALQHLDVGIMPLPDSPFERGKCGLKLIQYMASSRPVVASPVGVNAEIVRNGINGFIASDHGEWVGALRALREDVPRRERMGTAGRAMVEAQYCLSVTAPRLACLLRDTRDRVPT
jgi:glycosyltransferase involved in cell wall biosynthesis